MSWQPSADIDTLKKRSHWLQQVRAFFMQRQVMEVDVPVLMAHTVTDIHLDSVAAKVQLPGDILAKDYYLQTSPEFAMKRLLVAGSGDIFYLGKAFRDGDLSPRHQVEFTMLEWYRIGFSLQQLMQEVVELVQLFLPHLQQVEYLTYQQAFQKYAGIEDVFNTSSEALQSVLAQHQVAEVVGVESNDLALWRQLVLTEVIEPQLGKEGICCLSHFPAEEAALAKVLPQTPHLAERFEVYVQGLELANGYDELLDADTHRERFEHNQTIRQQLGKQAVELDEAFLTSLDFGLPACSGVALGFDRLLMLALEKPSIAEVVPFALSPSQ